MREIKDLCLEYGYNPETTAFLDEQWQKIKGYAEGYAVFMEQLETYRNNVTDFDHFTVLRKVYEVGDALGIQHKTSSLMLLIFMLPILREQYIEQNIPLRYFDAVVRSIRIGAEESFAKSGVAIAGAARWSMPYFKLTMFCIGRLVFKWHPIEEPISVFDMKIEECVFHIDVHIPGGTQLNPEAVRAAYDEARTFFEARYNKKGLIFGCGSWLLSPTLDEILSPTSNILAFAHEYTILGEGLDPTGEKVGHFVFGNDVDMKDVDALPENSSLQRGLKARLKAGKGIGTGFGVILPKE